MELFDIALLLIGVGLGAFIVYFLTSRFGSRRKIIPSEPHIFSLQDAEEVLKKSGFKIIEKDLKKSIVINVDGRDHLGIVPADFVVGRDKKRFLVIARGGSFTIDPTIPALRRELLEAQTVYNTEELILLNMSDQSIHEIRFEFIQSKNFMEKILRVVFIIFFIAVVIAILWLMVYLKLF